MFIRRGRTAQSIHYSHEFLVTLDSATPVIGHSYTEQWVRITDDEGRDGWIFHNLVSGRREGSR